VRRTCLGSSGNDSRGPWLAGRAARRLRGARLFLEAAELRSRQLGLHRIGRFLSPEFGVPEFIQSVTRLSDAVAQTGSVRCRSADAWCHGSVHLMSIWYGLRNSVVKRRFTWIPACFDPLTATSRRLRSGSSKAFQIQWLGDSLFRGSAPRISCVRVRQQGPRPGLCIRASANILRAPNIFRSTCSTKSFSPRNKNAGTQSGPGWSNKAQALHIHRSEGAPERVRESSLGGEAR